MSDGELPRVSRVAAYALCTDGDALLVTRIAPGHTERDDGRWTLPGGGVEFAEDPRDAALRELTEETGLVGEVVGLAGIDSTAGEFVDPRDRIAYAFHVVRILFHVRVVGGELRAEVGGSSDDCRWVPRAELAGSLPVVDLVRTGVALAFDR